MLGNNEDIDLLLFSTSTSKTIILNFMKSISLLGAAKCLKEGTAPELIEVANKIMEDVIEGYKGEEHSIQ